MVMAIESNINGCCNTEINGYYLVAFFFYFFFFIIFRTENLSKKNWNLKGFYIELCRSYLHEIYLYTYYDKRPTVRERVIRIRHSMCAHFVKVIVIPMKEAEEDKKAH